MRAWLGVRIHADPDEGPDSVTCIAAVRSGRRVVIGGDSAGVHGYSIVTRADEKVFTRVDPAGEKWAFGFTSSFRMGDLLRYKLEIPEVRPGKGGLREFMVTRFVDALRTCLRTGGWIEKDKDREQGGVFIVAFRGEIFEIHGDFQVAMPAAGYSAVGCGADLALGALYALHARPKEWPVGEPPAKWAVEIALEAANQFSAGVCPPYAFVELEQEGQPA